MSFVSSVEACFQREQDIALSPGNYPDFLPADNFEEISGSENEKENAGNYCRAMCRSHSWLRHWRIINRCIWGTG
jgi:hypothetical protein